MNQEDLIKQLVKDVREIRREQILNNQISVLEQQKQILGHLSQNSMSYNHVILLIGYAALFATWELTKGYLSKPIAMYIGLLSLLSVFIFSIYEIRKMVYNALFIKSLDKIVQQILPVEDRIAVWKLAFEEWSKKEMRIWPYYLYPTLIFGVCAALILVYQFAKNIIFG
jgi:hypothetical protein